MALIGGERGGGAMEGERRERETQISIWLQMYFWCFGEVRNIEIRLYHYKLAL